MRPLAVLRVPLLLAGVAALAFLPWQQRLHGEGWVRAGQDLAVYSPRPARLIAIGGEGTPIAAGAHVARLESPDLELRGSQAQTRLHALDARMQAMAAQAVVGGRAGPARETRRQLALERHELAAAASEARLLALDAPFAGRIVDVEPGIAPGAVVPASLPLARVVDASSWIGEVFVAEDELARVRQGARVRAYLDGVGGEVLAGVVEAIDAAPVESLPSEMLSAVHGGRIATADGESLKLRRPMYRLRIALDEAPASAQARRAAFSIAGERHSLAEGAWRALASVLIVNASF